MLDGIKAAGTLRVWPDHHGLSFRNPRTHQLVMLPQRMERLRFSRPYLQSDINGATTKGNTVVTRWEDIDKPGVAVAAQSGTFTEPVMGATLKQARLVNVSPPTTRERELEAGRVDVFMTDYYPYSRRLLDNADWATLISPPAPFNVLPYADAVKPATPSGWRRWTSSSPASSVTAVWKRPRAGTA